MESFSLFFALVCVCYPLPIQASVAPGFKYVEPVWVVLYYETMCPHCQHFYSGEFNRTATLWSHRLRVFSVPYGKSTRSRSYNGTYHFECQHGPKECYGNKLHACLIHHVGTTTIDVIRVLACMEALKSRGDLDSHADKCGELHNIDMKPVKECAKSSNGDQLLWRSGKLTEFANITGVPHILINNEYVEYHQYVPKLCVALGNPKDCENVSQGSN